MLPVPQNSRGFYVMTFHSTSGDFVVVFLYFVILVAHTVSFQGRADNNITNPLLVFELFCCCCFIYFLTKIGGEEGDI